MFREERITTPMGEFTAIFSAKGLKRLLLPPFPGTPPIVSKTKGSPHVDMDLSALLLAYLSGEPVDFSPVDLDLEELSAFTCKVLNTLRRVGYGETVTYSELALMVGRPKAQRAVGQAVKCNPFPIVVPCHRVVAQNGLGGFSSGLEWKRWLLELESGV